MKQWPVWVGATASLVALAAVLASLALWEDRPARAPLELEPAPSPGPSAPTRPPAVRAPPPTPLDAGRLPPDPPPADPREAVYQRTYDALAAELERRRPALVARCWPGGAPATPQLGLTLQIVVAADGREVGRGISEERNRLPAELRECVRRASSAPVRLPAPGRQLSLDVYVSYP